MNINHEDHGHPISGPEGKAARAKCREERIREIRGKVFGILDRHMDAVFTELDDLHTGVDDIADEDIIAALKAGGHDFEAEAYQEWIIEEDPSRDYRDPTPQGEELVTDPMDSDSNRLMLWDIEQRKAKVAEQLRTAKDAASPPLSTPAIDKFIAENAPKQVDDE
jgi:hypothetical protein